MPFKEGLSSGSIPVLNYPVPDWELAAYSVSKMSNSHGLREHVLQKLLHGGTSNAENDTPTTVAVESADFVQLTSRGRNGHLIGSKLDGKRKGRIEPVL